MDISNINYDPLVEKYRDLVTAAADTLWEYAEPAFQEYRSCALLKSIALPFLFPPLLFLQPLWHNGAAANL